MHSIPINIEDSNELLAFLREMELVTKADNPVVSILEGGVSNKTVFIKLPAKRSIVMKQALEKLRVKTDWYSSPDRIHREAEGLRWLIKIMPENVPSFLIEDHKHHILGMSAVPAPHENWKTMLLRGKIEAKHAKTFGHLLAQIHNAVEKYPEVQVSFSNRSFFESLRVAPYYAYAAAQVPAAKKHLMGLIDKTRKRLFALVHGDFSPKNVLIHNEQLYILDHEVMHFGDPAFDVGFALTHFISKAHHLDEHRKAFLQMASTFWEAYVQLISKSHLDCQLEYFSIQHTLACMLARVSGRSPLEYLSKTKKSRQKALVLALIKMPPTSISALIEAIKDKLD